MPPEEDSSFSNPVAPSGTHFNEEEDAEGVLTNDDFRKLLMTPRQVPGVAPPSKSRLHVPREYNENEDAALRRTKKKKYYAKLKKEEEEREKELAERYRDRARERRDGVNPDYQAAESSTSGTSKTTSEYRAVAPTSDASNSAAERRRMEIQESKFLGGDMEHTHLVKGLDFALLQKVRSEIANIDTENPEKEVKISKKDPVKSGVEIKTATGKKIYKALFDSKPPRRNELFAPGRMAYVFELEEDEYAETDIPTNSIRSKADCPVVEMQASLTTNDIVISKLTQILSYLRQGVRARKMKKKEATRGRIKEENKIFAEENIYGDFDIGASSKRRSKQQKQAKYFDGPSVKSEDDQKRPSVQSVRDMIKDVNDKFGKKEGLSAWDEVRADQHNRSKGHTSSSKSTKKAEPDSYAECYPGAIEMADAANDSDDEPDYTQMDMGNKKGPVKRWDFETEEEYNTYMESREAMPKAAFQFGIKMAEGRKTRTRGGHLDEKQKLDREWQKISKIISKRKGGEEGTDGGKRKKDY